MFVARITTEDEAGRKKLDWVPLAAKSGAEAQAELRKLLTEREENRRRHIGRSPHFAAYLDATYLPQLPASGKKPATITTEKAHYNRWRASLGHLRLDKIRPSHSLDALNKMKAVRATRTGNVALICLRHVLKAAKRDGYLKTLPTEDIPWLPTETKSRRLSTLAEIELICAAALTASKNGQQLADFLRFLAFCGGREQECLKIRWEDVDFARGIVTIGAEGDTKNRSVRRVDMNPALEAHLKDMATRRAPDSQWLFPSPQRGERDAHALTFRESLILARAAAGMESFGFHDCRHFFVSYCVMAGIDYMTIARWVGHRDGGILIGKVYGHLSNEHTQRQAQRINFAPTILAAVSAVA